MRKACCTALTRSREGHGRGADRGSIDHHLELDGSDRLSLLAWRASMASHGLWCPLLDRPIGPKQAQPVTADDRTRRVNAVRVVDHGQARAPRGWGGGGGDIRPR